MIDKDIALMRLLLVLFGWMMAVIINPTIITFAIALFSIFLFVRSENKQ